MMRIMLCKKQGAVQNVVIGMSEQKFIMWLFRWGASMEVEVNLAP